MGKHILILGVVLLVFLNSVNAYHHVGNGICACINCSDCITALNDNTNCSNEVKLTSNIVQSGTCINNPANFTNKTFDCQGYAIKGNTEGQKFYGIFAQGKDNITIKNCVVSGYPLNGSGVYLNSTHDSRVDNNTVFNSGAGILLWNSTNNGVTNNKVNNTHWAIISWDSSHFNRIINNTIFDTTGMDIGYGTMGIAIEVVSSNHNLVDNNYISNATTTYLSVGIYLEAADNNTLTNNEIYKMTTVGAEYPLGFGIYMESSANNTFVNNTINLNDRGVGIVSSSNNNFTGNDISNNTAIYGITFQSSSNNNKLIENTINNNGLLGGIVVYDSSNSNEITLNTLANNEGSGIYIVNSHWNNLSSNDISLSQHNGIEIDNSNHNSIFNNTLYRNHDSGIYLYSSSDNTLLNNTAESNEEGVSLINSTSTNNILKGNRFCYNHDRDIYDEDANSGSNNTCDLTSTWNDLGASRCTYACSAAPGDTNGDGNVDDIELLTYIEQWSQGLVDDADLLTAIEYWAT